MKKATVRFQQGLYRIAVIKGGMAMKYKTRDFGEIDLFPDRVLEFVQPILGYEQYTQYTLLYDEEIGTGIVWLQSLEEPGLCFLLADGSLLPDYHPSITEQQAELLGDGECLCLPIMVVPGNWKDATVNLKSPIIINTDKRKAMQVVLQEDYPIRAPLFGGKEHA